MAALAAHPQETVLEAPALEVVLELLLDIPRQGRALCRQIRLERGIGFLNESIEEGALPSPVRRRARPTSTSSPRRATR
jgi:hypothetical protein